MIKRTTSFLAIALVAFAFAFGGSASAQSGSNESGSNAGNTQQPQKLMKQYRQKAAKLQKIHKQTVDANPQLAAEQKKFEKQVREAVADQGYDVEKGQQRMQKMAKKLQSGDLGDSERKAVMRDFKAERQDMVKARNAALQKPQIKSAGKKLQQDTLAAMKKQNNNTQALLDDMNALRSKLRAKMPAAQSSAGS